MDEKNINSFCAVSGKCSGCQLNNLTYLQQLKLKQSKVNKLFYGIIKPEKIVPSPEIFRYRNKA
ncbi:MAG: 23S rRNA (uracil(1939)-C(5))-methyltransferase RlmD, partial [Clostridia bacterium]|nr:23S rRNA (uracil(1939)-C(5))-methyltransferase RlmD [Clostridia bacterium]